jgi:predicted nucleotidyltransferase
MLRDRVQAAYLFGSVARETADPHDVDLILIAESDLRFTRRWEMFEDIVDLTYALDLLIYTPEEFARLTSNPSGFWISVIQDLKRIV